MKSEKKDYLGTPPEEWDRMHMIRQPGFGKQMPSLREFSTTQQRETVGQLVLFENLAILIEDPRFAMTPIVGDILGLGLWQSVAHGELTHMQGAVLEQAHAQAIEVLVDAPVSTLGEKEKQDLFEKVAGLIQGSDPTASVVTLVVQMALYHHYDNYFTPRQISDFSDLHIKALNRIMEQLKKQKEEPK